MKPFEAAAMSLLLFCAFSLGHLRLPDSTCEGPFVTAGGLLAQCTAPQQQQMHMHFSAACSLWCTLNIGTPLEQ